jgi:hypothetical protein
MVLPLVFLGSATELSRDGDSVARMIAIAASIAMVKVIEQPPSNDHVKYALLNVFPSQLKCQRVYNPRCCLHTPTPYLEGGSLSIMRSRKVWRK